MNKLTAITAATITAVALALTGCSDGQTTASPGGGETNASAPASQDAAAFNDADVMFAQSMLAHHQQAIEMSDMLLAKDGVNEQVVSLAEDIKAAQEPEIEQMNSWLEAWGAEADGGMGGMDHDMGDMGGGGMMSEEDMAALVAASGPEASSLYLEQMIEHHEGAVTMAQEHIDQGENAEAVALAEKIVTDQQAEIEEMRALLDTL